MSDEYIREMLSKFGVPPGSQVAPLGNGLIHDSFAVSVDGAPAFVLQRLNTTVFPDPELLASNARVVTNRVREAVLARGGDVDREVLQFLPARDGRFFARDSAGTHWRMSRFVRNSTTVDVASSGEEAAMFSRAFALFHRQIWDVPPSEVRDAIPGFHDTPRRYNRFRTVVESAASGTAAPGQSGKDKRQMAHRFQRAQTCIREIHERAAALGTIETDRVAGRISTHVCHNDTKVNNVLLDESTRRPLCVIDFDTVGPGTPLMDVGDLLRTAAATVSEEEKDHTKVSLEIEFARAIVGSFEDHLGTLLNRRERDLLAFSGWVITMEQAIRYLADYLEGDIYYGERYPGQNLSRALNQLALAKSMEERFVDITSFR